MFYEKHPHDIQQDSIIFPESQLYKVLIWKTQPVFLNCKTIYMENKVRYKSAIVLGNVYSYRV